jgi:hypothetical protein
MVDDALLERARELVNGSVPSKNKLQKTLKVGWPTVNEVHPILVAEHEERARAAETLTKPVGVPEEVEGASSDTPTDTPDPATGRSRKWATYALVTVACAVASVGALAVTVAGFALSFDAGRAVAVAAYVNPHLAWLNPVAVDGLMAVAMVTAVVMRWLGRSNRYPWAVVIAGMVVSVACNAAHASIHGGALQLNPWAAMAVSAIPAVSVAASVHMLIVLALAVVHPREAADAFPR